jgi:alpha-beta hydrolase superfamily lysophospholipase
MRAGRATREEHGRAGPVPLALVGFGVLLVLVAVVALTSHDRTGTAGGAAKAAAGVPTGDAFYVPPKGMVAAAPGTVIRSLSIPAPTGARGWKVLYHSRGLDGHDLAVSGVVYAPTGPAPPGGRNVVSWAHGTTGVADACAPSRWADPAPGVPGLESHLRAGDVVAATDYQGLGTPGIHPYLVGASEGRGVLDIARAVQHLAAAHAGNRVVVDGHSQGGHAALFAGEVAPKYAPDLDVLGVSAGAPVTDVAAFLYSSRATEGFKGFPVLAAAGYHAVYPDAPLAALFSPQAIEHVDVADKECDLNHYFAGADYPILVADPSTTSPWDDLFRQNTPGSTRSSIPILVWQGGKDPLVPATMTAEYVQRACALGDTVTEDVYAGANHGSVLDAARTDVDRWIAARFAGTPVATACATVTHLIG